MPTPDPASIRRALRGGHEVPPPPPLELLDTDWEAWLRATHDSLWEWHKETRKPSWGTEGRVLTEPEWAAIERLIREHGLACEMHNACFGFGCGMAVYVEPPALYPGVPNTPERVLYVTQKHFGPGVRFDAGWAIFVQFTHTAENAVRLQRLGLPAPQAKSYYEY